MKAVFPFVIFFQLTHSALSQPLAAISIDRLNVCNGTAVQLMYAGNGANFFEWKINGLHHSFSEDTVATLYESCYSMQTIELIAADTLTGDSDTAQLSVEVFDTCFFHWTGDFVNCPGDTITFALYGEEISTQFTINPPHALLTGCLNCPSLSFILTAGGTTVDRTSTYLGGCSEITSFHYLCLLGLDEEHSSQISVFPNPASTILYIKGMNAKSVTIYSSDGRKIYDGTGNEVNCSGFRPGIYILKAMDFKGNTSVTKIVKSGLLF